MPDKLLRAAFMLTWKAGDFPSFLEGLSLRLQAVDGRGRQSKISLPFWKGFH